MVSRDLHLPGLATPPVPGRMDEEEAGVFNMKEVSTRARQFRESRGSAARLHPMSPKASCAPPPLSQTAMACSVLLAPHLQPHAQWAHSDA